MEWSRAQIKRYAKNELKQSYGLSIGVGIVNALIAGAVSVVAGIVLAVTLLPSYLALFRYRRGVPERILLQFIGSLIVGPLLFYIVMFLYSFFVTNILAVGKTRFFVQAPRGDRNFSYLFSCFKKNYKNTMVTMLLVQLFIFLWSLLFIIPGIIKSYEYRMIPYLLADNPELGWREAFAQSKQMSDGHKWEMFVLDLSFLGWVLLFSLGSAILSFIPILGIVASFAIYFLLPYIEATWAQYYFVLSGQISPQAPPAQEGYRSVV